MSNLDPYPARGAEGSDLAEPPDEFELKCLQRTLETLDLTATEILAPARLPENVNDPLLTTARPTWIGRSYRPGGVLLLGKNPGGGSVSYRHASHAGDGRLADAFSRLMQEQSIYSYRNWIAVQRVVMNDWRIWSISVSAIVGVLGDIGITADDIAFGNLVPFRTAENKVLAKELAQGWEKDLRPTIELLQPALIIKMTSNFPGLGERVKDSNVLTFRRANGDRCVTASGKTDLVNIKAWLAQAPR